jgi:hypothetical protein
VLPRVYCKVMTEISSLDELLGTIKPDVPQSVVCRVDGEYWLVRPKARVAGEVVAEGARRRKLVEITRSGGVWALRAAKWLRPQHLTTPRNVV